MRPRTWRDRYANVVLLVLTTIGYLLLATLLLYVLVLTGALPAS